MKITNEKVYRCDHCNRPMVRAGLMKIHERMCKKNPNNMHKCFDYCIHLKKTVNMPSYDYYTPRTVDFTCLNEKCNLFNTSLHSYKLERYERKKHRLNGLIRMPLACEFYKERSKEYYFL